MMASDLVLVLLKLNLAAGAAILLVLALRAPMRHVFGARIAYALWLIVPAAALAVLLPARTAPMPAPVAAVLPHQPAAGTAVAVGTAADPAPVIAALDLSPLIALVWLIGAVAAFALLAFRQRAFVASLGKLARERSQRRTLRAEATGIGPALIGSLFPKLILPRDFEARFDETERNVVLAHEDIHLRGRDPLINLLVALAQCLNWFNPLVQAAAHALRIDQELACDAAVIARFPNAKRRYAEAMLKTQIAPASLPLGCYWPARGEHPLKQRIAMLKRDLPSEFRAAWGAVAAGIVVLGASVAAWAAQPPVLVLAEADRPYDAKGADLIRAIERWDMDGAMRLIEANADVNYIRRGDASPLTATIAWERMAQNGGDVSGVRKSDASPLTAAAAWDMMWMTRQLLARGADPNLAVVGTGSPMISAARYGHHHIIEELIKHGGDVNGYVPMDETPLINAARWGQLNAVKTLVENGADVNLAVPAQPWFPGGMGTRTPLGEAVKYDQRRVVEYLKSKGARM